MEKISCVGDSKLKSWWFHVLQGDARRWRWKFVDHFGKGVGNFTEHACVVADRQITTKMPPFFSLKWILLQFHITISRTRNSPLLVIIFRLWNLDLLLWLSYINDSRSYLVVNIMFLDNRGLHFYSWFGRVSYHRNEQVRCSSH